MRLRSLEQGKEEKENILYINSILDLFSVMINLVSTTIWMNARQSGISLNLNWFGVQFYTSMGEKSSLRVIQGTQKLKAIIQESDWSVLLRSAVEYIWLGRDCAAGRRMLKRTELGQNTIVRKLIGRMVILKWKLAVWHRSCFFGECFL